MKKGSREGRNVDMMALRCFHVGMIRTQIQLDEEDFRRARDAARRSSISFSAFVRRSLRKALDEQATHESRQTAKALPGRFRSGRKDLARNHDQYLSDGW